MAGLFPDILNVPNTLTLGRILLVPFYVAALMYGYHLYALIIFFTASITDLLDGMIARMWNQKTRLGQIIDPTADRLLMISSFIIFAALGWVPAWLAITVISRDFIVISGTLIVYFLTDTLVVSVTLIGKITTTLQALLLGWVLVSVNTDWGLETPQAFFIIVLLFSGISCIQYIGKGLKIVGGR